MDDMSGMGEMNRKTLFGVTANDSEAAKSEVRQTISQVVDGFKDTYSGIKQDLQNEGVTKVTWNQMKFFDFGAVGVNDDIDKVVESGAKFLDDMTKAIYHDEGDDEKNDSFVDSAPTEVSKANLAGASFQLQAKATKSLGTINANVKVMTTMLGGISKTLNKSLEMQAKDFHIRHGRKKKRDDIESVTLKAVNDMIGKASALSMFASMMTLDNLTMFLDPRNLFKMGLEKLTKPLLGGAVKKLDVLVTKNARKRWRERRQKNQGSRDYTSGTNNILYKRLGIESIWDLFSGGVRNPDKSRYSKFGAKADSPDAGASWSNRDSIAITKVIPNILLNIQREISTIRVGQGFKLPKNKGMWVDYRKGGIIQNDVDPLLEINKDISNYKRSLKWMIKDGDTVGANNLAANFQRRLLNENDDYFVHLSENFDDFPVNGTANDILKFIDKHTHLNEEVKSIQKKEKADKAEYDKLTTEEKKAREEAKEKLRQDPKYNTMTDLEVEAVVNSDPKVVAIKRRKFTVSARDNKRKKGDERRTKLNEEAIAKRVRESIIKEYDARDKARKAKEEATKKEAVKGYRANTVVADALYGNFRSTSSNSKYGVSSNYNAMKSFSVGNGFKAKLTDAEKQAIKHKNEKNKKDAPATAEEIKEQQTVDKAAEAIKKDPKVADIMRAKGLSDVVKKAEKKNAEEDKINDAVESRTQQAKKASKKSSPANEAAKAAGQRSNDIAADALGDTSELQESLVIELNDEIPAPNSKSAKKQEKKAEEAIKQGARKSYNPDEMDAKNAALQKELHTKMEAGDYVGIMGGVFNLISYNSIKLLKESLKSTWNQFKTLNDIQHGTFIRLRKSWLEAGKATLSNTWALGKSVVGTTWDSIKAIGGNVVKSGVEIYNDKRMMKNVNKSFGAFKEAWKDNANFLKNGIGGDGSFLKKQVNAMKNADNEITLGSASDYLLRNLGKLGIATAATTDVFADVASHMYEDFSKNVLTPTISTAARLGMRGATKFAGSRFGRGMIGLGGALVPGAFAGLGQLVGMGPMGMFTAMATTGAVLSKDIMASGKYIPQIANGIGSLINNIGYGIGTWMDRPSNNGPMSKLVNGIFSGVSNLTEKLGGSKRVTGIVRGVGLTAGLAMTAAAGGVLPAALVGGAYLTKKFAPRLISKTTRRIALHLQHKTTISDSRAEAQDDYDFLKSIDTGLSGGPQMTERDFYDPLFDRMREKEKEALTLKYKDEEDAPTLIRTDLVKGDAKRGRLARQAIQSYMKSKKHGSFGYAKFNARQVLLKTGFAETKESKEELAEIYRNNPEAYAKIMKQREISKKNERRITFSKGTPNSIWNAKSWGGKWTDAFKKRDEAVEKSTKEKLDELGQSDVASRIAGIKNGNRTVNILTRILNHMLNLDDENDKLGNLDEEPNDTPPGKPKPPEEETTDEILDREDKEREVKEGKNRNYVKDVYNQMKKDFREGWSGPADNPYSSEFTLDPHIGDFVNYNPSKRHKGYDATKSSVFSMMNDAAAARRAERIKRGGNANKAVTDSVIYLGDANSIPVDIAKMREEAEARNAELNKDNSNVSRYSTSISNFHKMKKEAAEFAKNHPLVPTGKTVTNAMGEDDLTKSEQNKLAESGKATSKYINNTLAGKYSLNQVQQNAPMSVYADIIGSSIAKHMYNQSDGDSVAGGYNDDGTPRRMNTKEKSERDKKKRKEKNKKKNEKAAEERNKKNKNKGKGKGRGGFKLGMKGGSKLALGTTAANMFNNGGTRAVQNVTSGASKVATYGTAAVTTGAGAVTAGVAVKNMRHAATSAEIVNNTTGGVAKVTGETMASGAATASHVPAALATTRPGFFKRMYNGAAKIIGKVTKAGGWLLNKVPGLKPILKLFGSKIGLILAVGIGGITFIGKFLWTLCTNPSGLYDLIKSIDIKTAAKKVIFGLIDYFVMNAVISSVMTFIGAMLAPAMTVPLVGPIIIGAIAAYLIICAFAYHIDYGQLTSDYGIVCGLAMGVLITLKNNAKTVVGVIKHVCSLIGFKTSDPTKISKDGDPSVKKTLGNSASKLAKGATTASVAVASVGAGTKLAGANGKFGGTNDIINGKSISSSNKAIITTTGGAVVPADDDSKYTMKTLQQAIEHLTDVIIDGNRASNAHSAEQNRGMELLTDIMRDLNSKVDNSDMVLVRAVTRNNAGAVE